MEHPFLVEEFTPAHTTHASANRLAIAETQSSTALPPLPNLSASEVLFLTPSDPEYGSYLASANLRTQLSPALRAVCKTEHAVAVMIDWVSSNNLSFGIRCAEALDRHRGRGQQTVVVKHVTINADQAVIARTFR